MYKGCPALIKAKSQTGKNRLTLRPETIQTNKGFYCVAMSCNCFAANIRVFQLENNGAAHSLPQWDKVVSCIQKYKFENIFYGMVLFFLQKNSLKFSFTSLFLIMINCRTF